jgi:hypothetical protein
VTFFESFIIDTDHWRHYFLIIGLTWGIAVANRRMPKTVTPDAASAYSH